MTLGLDTYSHVYKNTRYKFEFVQRPGCKEYCSEYYPNSIMGLYLPYNVENLKKCTKCEITLITTEVTCRCCGNRFRYKASGKTKDLITRESKRKRME